MFEETHRPVVDGEVVVADTLTSILAQSGIATMAA